MDLKLSSLEKDKILIDNYRKFKQVRLVHLQEVQKTSGEGK